MYIPYGKTQLTLDLAPYRLGHVLEAKQVPSVDPTLETRKALGCPTDGSAPLAERVRPSDSVAIVVSDITRGWIPTDVILREIVNELHAAGISDRQITVLVAVGSHRKLDEFELERLVGSELFHRLQVLNHDCYDATDLVKLGITSRGTPVWLNRRYVEANSRILTGGVTYHFMAGFSGGRKSVLPGVAAYETIQANHRLLLAPQNRSLYGSGKTQGNPLHEDMMEVTRMAPPTFLVNAVPGLSTATSAIVAGNWDTAWEIGTRVVVENFGIPLTQRAPVVVASAGGFPLDINLYQSTKALLNAAEAVAPGGGFLLLAECADGTGAPEFTRWLSYPTLADMEKALAEGFTVPGFIAYRLRVIAEEYPTAIITSLPEEVVALTTMKPFRDVPAALEWLAAQTGVSSDGNGVAHVLPVGNITLPVLRNSFACTAKECYLSRS